ncbi:adenosine deaminase [Paraliomyxa miuraensis]|uniref:adenosine deaminase n=1 Tax=Paraliomyxa miuraensis TaxID=376150 RepID=UPI002252E867|nr:adenosine deaminase [Paraliomyxa miuraensis]MCX4241431.1 adenosine deaminase [Paraliomyxa miuraensis]
MVDLDAFVRALPKAELHLHLEGSVTPAMAGRLARRHRVEMPGAGLGETLDLRQAFPFVDFAGFLRLYLAIARCLQQAGDFAEIAEDLGRRLHEQGVGYAEVTFTPALHRSRGIDDAMMIEGLVAGRRAVLERHDVLLRWVFDVVRIFPEQAEPTLAFALAMERVDPGATVGLGLAGPEDRPHDVAPLVEAFARARAEGLRSLPHAGELAGPERIWEALRKLGADRIGHGVRCLDDPALVEFLREREVPLEVCPSSNVCLGVCGSIAEHPLPRIMEAGVAVSLGSDDPPLFGTDLVQEYLRVAEAFGWGPPRLRALAAASIEHAFMPAERATSMRAALAAIPDPE